MRQTIIFLLVLLFAAAPAQADILYLTNGKKLEGKVWKIEGGYKVKSGRCTVTVPEEEVLRWEKKATPEEEYLRQIRSLDKDDFAGQMAIGKWCLDQGLSEEAKCHYRRAVELRPDDTEARTAAGFARSDEGKWLEKDETARREGLENYGGRWMPRELAEKKRSADEQKNTANEVNRKTRALLLSAWKKQNEPQELARQILELGSEALPAVKLYSGSSSASTRETAYLALEDYDCAASLKTLLRCLKRENSSRLRHLLGTVLLNRSDRMRVLTALLDVAVNASGEKDRERAADVLEQIGDKRAVDSLVPMVELSAGGATTEEETDKDDSGGEKITVGGGVVSATDGDKPVQPGKPGGGKVYYPVHDALLRITDEMLPRKQDMWVNWWQHRREEFLFPHERAKHK